MAGFNELMAERRRALAAAKPERDANAAHLEALGIEPLSPDARAARDRMNAESQARSLSKRQRVPT